MDNFSNHPPSLNEIRADKTQDATNWTPRDALISALRDIDSGKIDPDSLVIIYNTKDDTESAKFFNATKGAVTLRGLVSYFLTGYFRG